jgi:DNA repair exonuclease SbcCD ATPase subunit
MANNNVIELMLKLKDEASKPLEKNLDSLRALKVVLGDASSGSDRVASDLGDVGNAAKKASGGVDDLGNSAESASRSTDRLGDNLSDTTDELRRTERQAERTDEEMSKLAKSIDGASTNFRALAGIAATALAAVGIGELAQEMKELEIQSERVGISVERLSAISAIANKADVDLTGISDALFDLQTNLQEFESMGSGAAADFFELTGKSYEEIAGGGRDAIEVLSQVYDAVKDLPFDQQNRLLNDMAGTDITRLTAQLRDAGMSLEEMVVATQEAGESISGFDSDRIAELSDRFNGVWNWIKATAAAILSALAPAINGAIDMFGKMFEHIDKMTEGTFLSSFTEFFKNFQAFLVATISGVDQFGTRIQKAFLTAIKVVMDPLGHLIRLKNEFTGGDWQDSGYLRTLDRINRKLIEINRNQANQKSFAQVFNETKTMLDEQEATDQARYAEEQEKKKRDASTKTAVHIDKLTKDAERKTLESYRKMSEERKKLEVEGAVLPVVNKELTNKTDSQIADLKMQEQLALNSLKQQNLDAKEYAKKEFEIKRNYANQINELELKLLQDRQRASASMIDIKNKDIQESLNKEKALIEELASLEAAGIKGGGKYEETAEKLYEIGDLIAKQREELAKLEQANADIALQVENQEAAHRRSGQLLESNYQTSVKQREIAEAKAALAKKEADEEKRQTEENRKQLELDKLRKANSDAARELLSMDDPVAASLADIDDRFTADIEALKAAGEEYSAIVQLSERLKNQVRVDDLIKEADRIKIEYEASDRSKEQLEAYRAEIARIQSEIDGFGGGEADQQDAMTAQIEAANNALTSTQSLVKELGDNIQENITDVFVQLLSGAMSFEDAMRTILSNILNQIGQILAQQAMMTMFGGMTGGAGLGSTLASYFHTGGLSDSKGGRSALLPSYIFEMTKFRYKTGGIAGLEPDEIPAVLHKGEEVLTANDPRHRNNGGLSAGTSGITIINQLDRDEMSEALISSQVGQKAVLNAIKANKADVKNLIE